ncbi:hypothetical protein [uncultured Succiniclasticum sp.]|uniref:hypothetical protein n=1 Tax=uncultured Succiniclasticum sp. TaxID=1500547 RepID=UPI0025EFCE79|nr:hypothetical protein [uncultured Succiniclasticum sp.]
MKKIIALVFGLLMMVNAAFAMEGFVEQQTINGVHCGMSPDEVVAKWGQPISQEGREDFYFNPGGLKAHFYTTINFSKEVTCLSRVYAKNNPQLVLKPSGVAIGMSEQEVLRRLGKPDFIKYMQWLTNDSGSCKELYYNMPRYTNYAGITGEQTVRVWICDDINKPFNGQVLQIWLDGQFHGRRF